MILMKILYEHPLKTQIPWLIYKVYFSSDITKTPLKIHLNFDMEYHGHWSN